MTQVKATFSDIAQAANSCNSTATEIQSQLATLQNYITQMEGWWQGIASTTFQDLMAEYAKYSAQLYQALTDIGSGLTTNHANYTDTESTNVKSVSSIQTQLSSVNFS